MIAKTILGVFNVLIIIMFTAFVITLFLPLVLYFLFMNLLENELRGELK